jgi:hypothetical protein
MRSVSARSTGRAERRRKHAEAVEKGAVLDAAAGAEEEEGDDEGELTVGEKLDLFDLADTVGRRHLVDGFVDGSSVRNGFMAKRKRECERRA